MLTTIYKINHATDTEGNPKELPIEWTRERYYLDVVKVGRSARLSWIDDEKGMGLTTSTVEEVAVIHGMTVIKTKNTVYWMKPHVQGV